MKSEEGFTLVELLVALAAGGFLLALLGWLVGTLSHELHPSARSSDFDQLEAAAPVLTAFLQTIRPADGSNTIQYDGDHLAGMVDPPLARRSGGPLKLDLTVARAADGEALTLELNEAGDAGGDPVAPLEHRQLVHGYKAIDIDVAPGERAGDPPRLISLHFVRQNGEQWDLAVEPRLNAIGGCRFDPISMTCRA